MRTTETVTTYTDDLDGSAAAATVQLGWQGRWYEIDLSDTNATELGAYLDRFVKAGRRLTTTAASGKKKSPAPGRKGRATASTEENRRIREWAISAGYSDISDRGPLKQEIKDAYYAQATPAPDEATQDALVGVES